MMNWAVNLYFREGPGISKDAPKPEGLRLLGVTLAREWWDLLKLNLLFIAASLPIITAPAAYLAMVTIAVAMIEDRNVYLWRDFWSTFFVRFIPASLAGIALCGGGVVVYFAVTTYAEAATHNLAFVTPLMIAVTVAVLLMLFAFHLFTALADGRERPLLSILKASLFGLFARPLPGLAALCVVALLWVAHILFYPASVLLPVLVNFSLGAVVSSFAVLKGVRFGFSRLDAAGQHKTQGKRKMQTSYNLKNGGENAKT